MFNITNELKTNEMGNQNITLKITLFEIDESGNYKLDSNGKPNMVTCEVESLMADAFEDEHPNTDWLEHLAEKKLGIRFLEMTVYEILN